MNDADGFRLEAAEQFGFEEIDGQDGPGQPGYFCTEAELIAFAKACERKGRTEAIKIAEDLYGEGPSGSWDNGCMSDGWDRGTQKVVDELIALNVTADAELTPILAAEEARFMISRGYVRARDDQPGARWIKPESPKCS